MTLEWNKITDKQPEWKQSVLAFNVLGNLIIIEYWRHDLKDTVTHWINKPKQPVDKEVIGFTKNIDKKGRMVSY
jgi:hypothetical protein